MAYPIGIASLIAVAMLAFQSSVTLYETINSCNSYLQSVSDLIEEISVLNEALSILTRTISTSSDLDLSAFELLL